MISCYQVSMSLMQSFSRTHITILNEDDQRELGEECSLLAEHQGDDQEFFHLVSPRSVK